jgi:gliding motility-associated-like protein
MKYFILISVLCCSFLHAYSQGCPQNIDFEDGSFTNWKCFVGTTYTENGKNVIDLDTSSPIPDRHEIITANADGTIPLDEYGNFPKVCPYGGKYSVKLGNQNTGAEAEGMSYTFTVPANEDTFSFNFFYAVVLENPHHAEPEQPRFFVTAYEVETGKLINCASYDYVSTGGLPGFMETEFNRDILYKNWSPVSIQFVNLGNKQVRLEFKTADCTQSGHFGYAYVDVASGCSNILATAPYCKETNSLLLNAPYGFKQYTWYNETYTEVLGHEQNLKLSPPPATTGKFYVDLVPYAGYGCRDTAYAEVHPLPVPDTPAAQPDYFYCQGDPAALLTAVPSINSDLLWYTDTTQPGSTQAIKPSTAKSGTTHYYVSQKVLFGCESFKKTVAVRVDPVPATSFTINRNTQCQDSNQFIFTSTSTNLQDSTFVWSFGDDTKDSTAVAGHSYKGFGNFAVKLKVQNGPACYKEVTNTVKVIPSPLAKFSFPEVICENGATVVLNDESSVPQGLSSVNAWLWKIGDSSSTAQNPFFIADKPGDLLVSLRVTTKEGCVSKTDSMVLKIHYQPKAVFTYDAPLCDNKMVHFINHSYLSPDAAGENVTNWLWQFDSEIVAAQNPVYHLNAGVHHAILMATSNFGCSSLPADSIIETFPRPVIALHINDSCINRSIHYMAEDKASNVAKWYWNFGNGTKEGKAVADKYFHKAGDNSFTLYGQTAHGCMDTVQRHFTIFENKAFAGRDTLVASNQPVQLMANGGTNNHYTWSPSLGLSDPSIENPVATLDRDQWYRLDAITNEGCDSHSRILIKRYLGPDIYIPTAFTPNNDLLNDVLKAMPVGMKSLSYFAVYNRLGQRVFYTTDFTKGWNGLINNVPADTGAYAAIAQATDYTGKTFIKRVAVVLIR